jgi:hypothetical protein
MRPLQFSAWYAAMVGLAHGAAPLSTAEVEFFEKRIRPVLVQQCMDCHNQNKVKAGLYLDSREGVHKGGETGPLFVVGNPDKSLLIQAIRYTDDDLQMPPKHRLTPEQVRDFEEWVRMGAPDPRDGKVPLSPSQNLSETRKHWSFQPVREPQPPEVKTRGWARNEIDAFLLFGMEAKGVTPSQDADPRGLLRRATYDLTGLPPTPEETRTFLADKSRDAFAKVIDRLLASHAYGERWGRHWLDVVRYADTSGCNSDYPIPSAYRYRNYVIDSLNADKPYDQFLKEQIAGDLLPTRNEAERQEKVIATGYLANARRFGSRANEFHLTIEDILDNLGKATMGLSIGCARCHDHKYDPISNRDYYALYGIFSSSTFAFPGTEIYKRTKDFVPLTPDKEAAKIFWDESREAAALDDRIERLKGERKAAVRAELAYGKQVDAAKAEGKEVPSPPKRTLQDVETDLANAQARQKEIVAKADGMPKAYAVTEGEGRDARIQKKGEPRDLGDEVPRGWLTLFGGQTLPPEEKGSGRKQLAAWLTDPANPLVARVMVNRIWQHHFGRGIVKSPNDFGIRGEPPTHPELLDWLAARFAKDGWSLKKMHKRMMLSRAYQLSTIETPDQLTNDAANDTFAHFNRRRLSAEELRDSVMAIAGTLDRNEGGPHPFPPEREWTYTQHKQFYGDYPTPKRTVYMMLQRIRKQAFLATWDGADTNATTAARPLSTTPLQALWAMNDGDFHEQSRHLAQRLTKEFSDEDARLQKAFELCLGREATDDEIAECRQYLAALQPELSGIPADQRPIAELASFGRVLLSSNEFLYVE